MRPLVLVALVTAACSGNKSDKTPGTDKAQASAETKGPAAAAPDKPVAEKPAAKEPAMKPAPPSPEALAVYRKHLKKGRALARRKEWKKAAGELEGALEAIPNDGRALSELGWVAFQAGDYDRAGTVNAASVKYAAESAVKAASLYNLGRVAEAQGKQKEAAKHYKESLRVRPGNKAVEKRLAQLGGEPPPVGDFDASVDSICKKPVTRDKLCTCKTSDYGPGDDSEEGREGPAGNFDCSVEDSPLPDFAYVHTSDMAGGSDYHAMDLAVRLPDGTWRLAASLTYVLFSHGRTEEWSVDKLEKRKVGGKEILWIEMTSDIEDMWYDTEQDYDATESYVLLCTLPDVTCAHRFPVAGVYSTVPVDEELEPTGKPETSSFQAELTLAPDGTATLRLTSGSRKGIEGFLGTHKLW